VLVRSCRFDLYSRRRARRTRPSWEGRPSRSPFCPPPPRCPTASCARWRRAPPQSRCAAWRGSLRCSTSSRATGCATPATAAASASRYADAHVQDRTVCRRMRPLRVSFEASGRAHHVKLRKLSSPETKDHVARTKHQLAKSEMRRGPFASAPGQALPPSPCPHVLRRRPLRAPSTCSALVIVCSPCSGAANPCGAVPWHLCWHRVLPPPPLGLRVASSTSVHPLCGSVLATPLHAPASSSRCPSIPKHRRPPCTQVSCSSPSSLIV
jgi:hypothetical protein